MASSGRMCAFSSISNCARCASCLRWAALLNALCSSTVRPLKVRIIDPTHLTVAEDIDRQGASNPRAPLFLKADSGVETFRLGFAGSLSAR